EIFDRFLDVGLTLHPALLQILNYACLPGGKAFDRRRQLVAALLQTLYFATEQNAAAFEARRFRFQRAALLGQRALQRFVSLPLPLGEIGVQLSPSFPDATLHVADHARAEVFGRLPDLPLALRSALLQLLGT